VEQNFASAASEKFFGIWGSGGLFEIWAKIGLGWGGSGLFQENLLTSGGMGLFLML